MTPDREPAAPDQDLLQRFVAGESRAYQVVVGWARDIVRFRPYRIPGPEHEDVVQESVGMVWRACTRPDFALRTSMRALTRQIVLARCVDHLRRQRESVPLGPALADPQPNPEERLAESQHWAHVQRALRQLDDQCREIIRMHFLDEIPYAEVAIRLGVAPPTVRMRMFHCMKRVRKLLDVERQGTQPGR